MKTRKLKGLLVAALLATGLYAAADVPGDIRDFEGCRDGDINGDNCTAVAGWIVFGCVNNVFSSCEAVIIDIEDVNP
jgi:hypothetical protein